MLLTIVAIWALVIPLVVLAVSWQLAAIREARDVQATEASPSGLHRVDRAVPRCAVPATRPRRTTTRRVCPEQLRRVGRRSASA
jgi:hypothetical protein